MIPPTSPGADSTPVERDEDARWVEGLAAITGATGFVLERMVRIAATLRDVEALRAALLRSQQEREALATALRDCADDLEARVNEQYGHPDVHPALQRRYDRDMELVLTARRALNPNPTPSHE